MPVMSDTSAHDDQPLIDAWEELLTVDRKLEAGVPRVRENALLARSCELREFIADFPALTPDGLEIQLRLAAAEVEGTRAAHLAMLEGKTPTEMEHGTTLIWKALATVQRMTGQARA